MDMSVRKGFRQKCPKWLASGTEHDDDDDKDDDNDDDDSHYSQTPDAPLQ